MNKLEKKEDNTYKSHCYLAQVPLLDGIYVLHLVFCEFMSNFASLGLYEPKKLNESKAVNNKYSLRSA